MKIMENGLPPSVEKQLVSRHQAKKMFYDGVPIYANLFDDFWVQFDHNEMEDFPGLEYTTKCYIESADECVIIATNKKVIKYLKERGVDGTVIKTATSSDVKGRVVYNYGNPLSLRLVADCKAYYEIQDKVSADKKGYTVKRYRCDCEKVYMQEG